MKTGAVIAAAGMSSDPMLNMGNSTIIKRIITTMQQADVDPIVVVTGNRAEVLEKHISHMGVISVKNERYEKTQMFDSAKIGILHLKDQCDRFFFTPVDVSLFTVKTLQKLMECSDSILCPVFKKTQGHPLLISTRLITEIIDYEGIDGMSGAISHCKVPVSNVQVDDEGILYDVGTQEDCNTLLKKHNEQMLHVEIQMKLSKETGFFGPGVSQLLKLVDSTGSISSACELMHMSYSKGWKMINLAEQQLGYPILVRQAGGINGGNSELTEDGKMFVNKYLKFVEESKLIVQQLFYEYFV
ncbi:MAG: NTP transferase domain-containing protein [Clostridiaceae bacterium]